jgi:predicted nucleic acid-binding protein
VTYLLDTNVVSALRVKGRHPLVQEWVDVIPVTELFVAAMTIAELERGVIMKEREDPDQGSVLREWFDQRVLPAFADRVLPFDLSAARVLATFRVPERAPLDDGLIAAIAHSRQMTVVTRNTKHFEPLGVSCLDPWEPEA